MQQGWFHFRCNRAPDENRFSVHCLTYPLCATSADSLDEAPQMGADALKCYLEEAGRGMLYNMPKIKPLALRPDLNEGEFAVRADIETGIALEIVQVPVAQQFAV